MTDVFVWGKAAELIAGETPGAASIEEIDSLERLSSAVSPATLAVMVDANLVPDRGAALQAWLESLDGARPALIAIAEPGKTDEVIERLRFVDDVLQRPVSAALLKLRLERAELQRHRQTIDQLDAALEQKARDLDELNAIGVALSAEHDLAKLLELILRKCREITAADADSLYLVESKDPDVDKHDQLRFKLAQNDTVDAPFAEITMPLTQTSIAGYCTLSGEVVNVADAYDLPKDSPFQISRSWDEESGYRTKSMLVVPMRDHLDKVIGVVQLINKKRDAGAVLKPQTLVESLVTSFTQVDEQLVSSLASQAAVAIENNQLLQKVRNLFASFVEASVTAIESRDPTTSGHSARVAELTVGTAEIVAKIDTGQFRDVRFSKDQLQEIRYASLLHDFGKVGVREKVLIKGKKLYVGEMLLIRQRFNYIRRSMEAEYFRNRLGVIEGGRADERSLERLEVEFKERTAEAEQILEMVVKANEPSIMEEESFRALMDLPNRTFEDIDGSKHPLISPNELAALSIRRGSLSDKERREIESHVTHTFRFLAQIPWTGEFEQIPQIAYAHHEKLDGSGYPRQLKAAEIPIQSKMMTISDIFDALVAWDRPYKKAVPVERALDILGYESQAGKIDQSLLAIFIESKIYERGLRRRQGTDS